MRVRKKWDLTVDAIDREGVLTVSHAGQDYRIRVIKVTLPGGEVVTLLTNLSEKLLPVREAAELYFKRRGIETAYDILNSKLPLENLSGKTAVLKLTTVY